VLEILLGGVRGLLSARFYSAVHRQGFFSFKRCEGQGLGLKVVKYLLMRWKGFIFRRPYLVLLALLLGCVPSLPTPELPKEVVEAERLRQRKLALFAYLDRLERLLRVSDRLLIAASPFCKDQRPVFGFSVHDRTCYREEDLGLLSERFRIGDGITVWYVHPELPAGVAGLRPNDRILKVNSREPRGIKEFVEVLRSSYELELVVEREGEVLHLRVQAQRGCNCEVHLVQDDSLNAWAAPGGKVYVTTGLMRFIHDEDELAFVLGHELSHHVLGHLAKRTVNVLLGTLLDVLVSGVSGVPTRGVFQQLGALVFSEEFEKEADYLGTYLAARAGYDVRKAPDFWRRMAVEFPQAISKAFLATHPSTPERFTLVEKAVEEIERKRQTGEELVPTKLKKHP